MIGYLPWGKCGSFTAICSGRLLGFKGCAIWAALNRQLLNGWLKGQQNSEFGQSRQSKDGAELGRSATGKHMPQPIQGGLCFYLSGSPFRRLARLPPLQNPWIGCFVWFYPKLKSFVAI